MKELSRDHNTLLSALKYKRMYLDPHFHFIAGYLLNYHNVEKKVLYVRKIVILAKIPQNFIKE